MNRKWWSFLIPAIVFLLPTRNTQASVQTVSENPDLPVSMQLKRNTRNLFTWNPRSETSYFYTVGHTSHASHASGAGAVAPKATQDQATPDATQKVAPDPNSQSLAPASNLLNGVILNDTVVRILKSDTAKQVSTLSVGQLVRIVKVSGIWTQIQYTEGGKVFQGWIKSVDITTSD